jgi:hypothetical protein
MRSADGKSGSKRPIAQGGDYETSCSSHVVFVLSLVIAVLAVVSVLTPIPYITAYAFWVAIIAYVILAVGNLVET